MAEAPIEGTLTSKGQITIPAAIRRRLGLSAGDRVEFVSGEGGTVLRPIRKTNPFAQYAGRFADSIPASIGEIVQLERRNRGHAETMEEPRPKKRARK